MAPVVIESLSPGGVPPSAEALPPPRSFLARTALSVLGRWGARLGLLWIGVLLVLAVFGPFIANSHPILMKSDGVWSSPMMRHLTVVDVTLVVAALTGIVAMALRPIPRWDRWWSWVAVVAATTAMGFVMIKPPQAVVYSQYREGLLAGEIERAFFAPVPFSPTDRMRDQPEARLKPPSREHLMGTTAFGEDLFSRMIHACRIALAVGLIATGIAIIIGVTIGGLMGYFSGWVDLLGMRLVEVFSAIPTIFLLIAIVAFYGRNLYIMMVVIGLTGWVGYALFVRAEFLRLRQQDFVQAAIACGIPLRSILFRHMLPNGVTPVLVSASFGIAGAILTESTLSFLGLGLVEEPSWGQMLNQAREAGGSFFWWIAIFPGMAIFLTIFAYNLVGEALRDAIDPHLARAAQL